MKVEGREAAPETALAYLELAARFFAGRGIASARLDAELLLAEVLGTDRIGVYLRFDRPLAGTEVDAYRALVKRRGGGEPVAHLLGRREFWSRSFVVTPDVLVPRPETELVVERALAAADAAGGRARPLRILDLGTGSGALAVTLAAELPQADVTAVDASPAALAVAGRNAAALGVAARTRFLASDWTTALAAAARFDLVVSNPPYVPSGDLADLPPEVRREPTLALDGGPDGLAAYRRIAAEAARVLAPGGALVCEVGAGQAAAVAALFEAAGLGAIGRFADLAGIERVVIGTSAGAPAARAAS
ncbi:MAG: peptide chain release factor N(5)-glutamine methyltransferase [Deltaproteobacteria bacterium]|nr:peptide chain release factor N(5)-glutamine methyltransferase [Deltaproteobacteria bacterium]